MQVTPITADCADEGAISGLCERAVTENGKLDFFFANAGILGWHSLSNTTTDEFLNIVKVNTLG